MGGGDTIATWKTYPYTKLFFVIQERSCTPVLSSTFSFGLSHTPSPSSSPTYSYISLSFSTPFSPHTSSLYSPNFSFSASLNTTSISRDTGGEPLGTQVQSLFDDTAISPYSLPFSKRSLFSLFPSHSQAQVRSWV